MAVSSAAFQWEPIELSVVKSHRVPDTVSFPSPAIVRISPLRIAGKCKRATFS